MKNWIINGFLKEYSSEDILLTILKNRGIRLKNEKEHFLNPPDPVNFTPKDVGVEQQQFHEAVSRIKKAIKDKESIVVYADYDADGITAGAVMWEALFDLGARVMPYIPHRVEEGYGLSEKGIDTVQKEFDPTLIITVDHGITAAKQIAYAKKHGIDVIVIDHHIPPSRTPSCILVHTTQLSGAGVAWFVAKTLLGDKLQTIYDLLALAAMGTIADLVPLVGANRSIAKYGLAEIQKTKRLGVVALVKEAGVEQKNITTTDISHILVPRLNAMGRLEHAIDALRLLCTRKTDRATELAAKLGMTNRERQQLTIDTSLHAIEQLKTSLEKEKKKILFISDASYNQGIIGLVAGKLVETYYLPSVVIAQGAEISKASARSIRGVNIIEFIREAGDLLLDVGGHPMAAGFTVETKNLDKLKKIFEENASKKIPDELLQRSLAIELELPASAVTEKLWSGLQKLLPFGIGNYEPIFATRHMTVEYMKLIGVKQNHLKLKLSSGKTIFDAIGFGMGEWYASMKVGTTVDVAYTIDMNTWNGNRQLQLKLRDIHID